MLRSEKIAIITVNSRQRKLLLALSDLHLITIDGCDNLYYTLSGRVFCSFAYISGFTFITNTIYNLINNGFLVSEDGPDRRGYNEVINILNRGAKNMGREPLFKPVK